MRYFKTLAACTAMLAISSIAQAETIAPNGKADRIEWKVQSNWKIEGKPIDIVHSLDHKLVFILSADQNVLVYDKAGKLEGKIPVGENVTAIDIAPQGESLYLIDDAANTFTSVALSYVVDIDTTGSYFLGNPDAPVTIALFTDFECPYCKKLEPLLKQVVSKNKENVKLVFKNMPLKFHKLADPSHRAALAAGEQGKFWPFHDKLFEAPKLSNELIDSIAQELGLDMTKFKADMNSPKIRMMVNKDLSDAQKAGVTGTPTVFINGRKLQQRSMAGFQQLIDEELAKKEIMTMNNGEVSKDLLFDDNQISSALYGDLNRNLQLIENSSGVKISARGTSLSIKGFRHDVDIAAELLNQLYDLIGKGYPVYSSDFAFGMRILESTPGARLDKIFLDKVYVTTQNRVISPKTRNQKIYIDAIRNHDIVFGIGPAGTGKTYLAVAMAVSALSMGQVKSIILTRPAVEAGEKLGFLPGDLAQKVNPYLRPLHDALNDMVGSERCEDLLEQGTIEIAPLAFMRGRTLSNAFIILDEAQNTTREQMKMFLTRIGFDSRAVVTGDSTQVDLPQKSQSGLLEAKKRLKEIEGISFCSFSKTDVVRHPLVQKIIQAYETKMS